jgi:hypothetical protein
MSGAMLDLAYELLRTPSTRSSGAHHRRISEAVELHHSAFTLGQQGAKADPERLGVSGLTRP